MTTNTKIVLALGAIAAVVLLTRKKAAAATDRGRVTFEEFQVADCQCFKVRFFADGTTESTRVDNSNCADVLASSGFEHCNGGA